MLWMRTVLTALVSCSLVTAVLAKDTYDKAVYDKTVKISPLMKTSVDSQGQPIHYPRVDKPEVSMLQVELPPGTETGWHTHPVPGFAYIVSGTLTVEYEGGKREQFNAGQGVAEVVNTLHNGKNLGSTPVKLWVVFTGEKDKPFAIKASK